MSFKSKFVKLAIKCTPNKMVIWVANIILKGIAELDDLNFDLDTRKVYVKSTLYGETEAIELWLNGFALVSEEDKRYFVLQQAESNKPWLNTILGKVVGKSWPVPAIPQLNAYINLVAELLPPLAAENPETPESEEINDESEASSS